MKDDKIQELAKQMGDEIKASGEGAVFTLTEVDDRLTMFVAGNDSDVTLMLAKAIARTPELTAVLQAAIVAAPMVGILYGEGNDPEVCDCPNCIERRANKAAETDPDI